MLAADGRTLKSSLNRALRREKLRAFMLIVPLLVFVLVTFVAPIVQMLYRSVDNELVSQILPRTVVTLEDWDYNSGEVPDEAVFDALARDFMIATERKDNTRLGVRLNQERSAMGSLMRKTGRGVDDLGEVYTDQFADLDEAWEEPATWIALFADPDWVAESEAWAAEVEVAEAAVDAAAEETGSRTSSAVFTAQRAVAALGPEPAFRLAAGVAEALPRTAEMYLIFGRTIQEYDEDTPLEEEPWHIVYTSLYEDLAGGADVSGFGSDVLDAAAEAAPDFETFSMRDGFAEIDDAWVDPEVWGTIQTFSSPLTSGFFLKAVDLELSVNGVQAVDDDVRIYLKLFFRTLWMSLAITCMCILLGYPIAWLMANLPDRSANLIMILVLLPFWTSLLVRTSAWKVLLQQQGVINDTLVWIGLVADDGRLALINNVTGTVIAMTHILLPFMILPLYSVMKGIPPSYLRAAKSLGATNWTAFWRVYFPQSVPGIGAGSILVFILSIGYYITPEIVGGTKGVFISNRIAYFISESPNWGLAAALGTILLVVVMALYWAYDRIVGIDNVKLGG